MSFRAALVHPAGQHAPVVVFTWAEHEIFRWTVSELDHAALVGAAGSPAARQRLVDLYVAKQLAKVWHAHPS